MNTNSELTRTPAILTVYKLLCSEKLVIPEYQRPYKWTVENVEALLGDVARFKDKPSYRLGTIVFHYDEKYGELNIVDGQQRIITLCLIVNALMENGRAIERIKEPTLRTKIKEIANSFQPTFSNEISQDNIKSNYIAIERIVRHADFSEEIINFLVNKCEVVTFTLCDIEEAFQFFDSQNSRGRELDPHDLLKAYHLRAFGSQDQEQITKSVQAWENTNDKKLKSLFTCYWFRIRYWSKGLSVRHFSVKHHLKTYKGVSLDSISRYPHTQQIRIAHHYIEQYCNHADRKFDEQERAFPFQLDQMILNGHRFFEMTNHYLNQCQQVCEASVSETGSYLRHILNDSAKEILKVINHYDGRFRTGDRYVRELFDCLLLYYIDRFGMTDVSRAIEKIFIWAYTLRLENSRIGIASIDNYVRSESNLFRILRESIHPVDFLQVRLRSPKEITFSAMKVANKTISGITSLFQKLNYLPK